MKLSFQKSASKNVLFKTHIWIGNVAGLLYIYVVRDEKDPAHLVTIVCNSDYSHTSGTDKEGVW